MSVSGSAIVAEVEKFAGYPYKWGATGPGSFDCSGLVSYVLSQLGVTNVPRTSEGQWAWVQKVPAGQLRPGDLVFAQFPGDSQASPGHVGIYTGNGKVLSAEDPASGVRYADLSSWAGSIVGYGRVPGAAAGAAGRAGPAPAGGQDVTTAADVSSIVGDVTGALGAAGTLMHDVAEALNFGLEFFKPGQMWRIGMGAGAAAAGVGAVRLYRSPSAGSGRSAEAPLAILLTGAALTGGYMALRPWPVGSGGRPIRPAAYVHEILGGHPPSAPPPPNDTGVIEAGLWAVLGIWAASKVAGGLGNLAAGVGGILGGIIGWLKGLGKVAGEVPIE